MIENASHSQDGLARRSVLAGSGAVAAAAVLAACSTGDGGASPAGDAGDGGSGGTVAPGQTLTPTADVPVGGAVSVTVNGESLLVTQPTEGKFAAFSAICTHQGCTVLPGDGELNCPCHNSLFDLATGDVTSGPAPRPLPAVEVTVSGGAVTTV